MIAADFLGDPTGYRIGHALPNGPCECPTDSRKVWACLCRCNSAHGAGRLHGSTKVVGVGRLWKTSCAPVDLDRRPVALHGVILPPEMRHSRPAPFRWSSG